MGKETKTRIISYFFVMLVAIGIFVILFTIILVVDEKMKFNIEMKPLPKVEYKLRTADNGTLVPYVVLKSFTAWYGGYYLVGFDYDAKNLRVGEKEKTQKYDNKNAAAGFGVDVGATTTFRDLYVPADNIELRIDEKNTRITSFSIRFGHLQDYNKLPSDFDGEKAYLTIWILPEEKETWESFLRSLKGLAMKKHREGYIKIFPPKVEN